MDLSASVVYHLTVDELRQICVDRALDSGAGSVASDVIQVSHHGSKGGQASVLSNYYDKCSPCIPRSRRSLCGCLFAWARFMI